MPAILDPLKPEDEEGHADGDVFASKEDEEAPAEHPINVPEGFEELPIEIRSLTERYACCLDTLASPDLIRD